MKNRFKLLVSMSAVMAFLGCAAHPQVRYYDLGQDKDGMQKFTLPKSYIHVDLVTSQERAPFLDVKSVPSDDYPESAKYSFMMKAVHRSAVSTNITQFTTLPNTRIPAAIGIEVIDNRKEMIETFARAAGLFAILKAPPELPFNATVIEVKDADNQDLPLNKNWKYSLKISEVPQDALPFDEFKKMTINTDLKVFPYSACRTASLTLVAPKDNEVFKDKMSFKIKVADPAHVSLIEIPSKGQITMHPSCGVDVKSEKSSGGSVDWGLLGNLIQKVKDLKESIDKKDK